MAVMVMFMISGFANRYSMRSETTRKSARIFAGARALRIAPTLFVGLALSWGVAGVIRGRIQPIGVGQLAGNLTFAVGTRPGWPINPYYGNSPLWSLSYEVWYYAAFFVLWTVGRKFRSQLKWIALATSVLGIVGSQVSESPFPLFALLFIVWWVGAEFAAEFEATGGVSLRRQAAPIASVVLIAACWVAVVVIWADSGKALVLDEYPATQLVQLSGALLAIFAAFTWQAIGWRLFEQTVGLFRVIAPISFGIYAFHYPLLQLAEAKQFTGQWATELLWLVPLTIVLAYAVDVRLQRVLRRFLVVGPHVDPPPAETSVHGRI